MYLDHSTDKGHKGLGVLLLDEMKNWDLFPLDWPPPSHFSPPHQSHAHTHTISSCRPDSTFLLFLPFSWNFSC